jgi:L-ribulose-5-phosphate 3-epimerase
MTNDIGVMLNFERDRLKAFGIAARLGFRVVHTCAIPEAWLTGAKRESYIQAARDSGLAVASMFVGFDGQSYADLASIRRTVGFSITGLRDHRKEIAKRYSELAAETGSPSLSAHIGFLPNRERPEYSVLLSDLREVIDRCAGNRQSFHLETGQEPAEALLRFIKDVARPNVGVNFDPGNFLIYGTDETLRALEVLAPHLKGVHCKDGLRPKEPEALGTEVPLGQGAVDFPALIRRLAELSYTGPLILERETGPNVEMDLVAGRAYLERLVRECELARPFRAERR